MTGNGEDLSGFSMLELFRAEVEEHGATLSDGLLKLENDPSAAVEIESLMRAAHSIKGAARIVEIDAVVRTAHALEDCFVAAQGGAVILGSDEIDVLLRGLDLITQIANVEDAGLSSWLEQHSQAIDIVLWQIATVQDPSATLEIEAQPEEPETATAEPDAEPKPPPPPAPSSVADDLSGFSMLELFREEVESQAAILSNGLLQLESNPSAASEHEALMRAAHSVKGAARIVDLDAVVRVAHAMEDTFVAAQEERISLRSENIDVLLQGVDLITRIAGLDKAGLSSWLAEHGGEIDAVVAAVTRILEPGQSEAPAATPPSPPVAAPRTAAPRQPSPAVAPARAVSPVKAVESRDLRISAENLTRLMGLAGESVVAAGWLEPFAHALRELKTSQVRLADRLEEISGVVQDRDDPDRSFIDSVTEAVASVGQCRQILSDRMLALDTFTRRTTNLSDRLYREVLSSRMRPFADGMKGFPRLVRDLARSLNKKVRLEIVGHETEVDRDIMEKLEAPLNHIIRNAVDHGIEAPQVRLAAGKDETGVITVEARHSAGKLRVAVADDGQGIDEERLREKIIARELADAEMVAKMSSAELMAFLFLPGFTTSEKVTEISGRGVGLDVVQSMVQEVGGDLSAESALGAGVTFILQLPVTRSVIRTLLVEVSGEPFAFPLSRIDHTLVVSSSELDVLEDRQYFTFDGNTTGMVFLSQILELPPSTADRDEYPVVVVSDRSGRFGVVVDHFIGERDVVVHPLDRRLGKVPDISAAALTEDGSPVLIIDVEDMVRSVDVLLSEGRLRKASSAAEEDRGTRRKRILVVEDSITVREVERQLLENSGYEVETAVDGMDGWNAIRSRRYDLVISDIDMPRMTGIELVTRIKSDPALEAIPVMIVSYKDREEDRLKGLDAGANYYLTKSSFHDETMLNAVADLIGGPTE